jgi:hypothetical protein
MQKKYKTKTNKKETKYLTVGTVLNSNRKS